MGIGFLTWILLLSGIAFAGPEQKILTLLEKGDLPSAEERCAHLAEKGMMAPELQEACAETADRVLRARGTPTEAQFQSFSSTWAGTKAAKRALEDAAKLALASAHTTSELEHIRSAYPDSPEATIATTRLRALDWQNTQAQATIENLITFATNWPGSDEAKQALLLKDGLVLDDILAHGTRTDLDAWLIAHPLHPRAEEAQLAQKLEDASPSELEVLLQTVPQSRAAEAALLRVLREVGHITIIRKGFPEQNSSLHSDIDLQGPVDGLYMVLPVAFSSATLHFDAHDPNGQASSCRITSVPAQVVGAQVMIGFEGAIVPCDTPIHDASLVVQFGTLSATIPITTPETRGESLAHGRLIAMRIAGLPTGMNISQPAPITLLTALLDTLGRPAAGTFTDNSNFSLSWIDAATEMRIDVINLRITISIGNAKTGTASPPALNTYLSNLSSNTWTSARTQVPAQSTWQTIVLAQGRALQATLAGTTLWIRLVDPTLHAVRTWSFPYKVDRKLGTLDPSWLSQFLSPLPDASGLVALNNCTVQMMDCEGGPTPELLNCGAQVVAMDGSAPAAIRGLGSNAGFADDGSLGDQYSAGGINGYCYDISKRARWLTVEHKPEAWVATPDTKPHLSSGDERNSVPAGYNFKGGEDIWCGDVTYYTTGILTSPEGIRISTKAYSASLYGHFLLFNEIADDCNEHHFLYDTSSHRKASIKEDIDMRSTLEMIGDHKEISLDDIATGRFHLCNSALNQQLLVCEGATVQIYDRNLAPLPQALDGLNGTIKVVNSDVLGLIGSNGARWLVLQNNGQPFIGPLLPSVTALASMTLHGHGALSETSSAGVRVEAWNGQMFWTLTQASDLALSYSPDNSHSFFIDLQQQFAQGPEGLYDLQEMRTAAVATPPDIITAAMATPPGIITAAIRVGDMIYVPDADGITWRAIHL